jgi:hypothetical protein
VDERHQDAGAAGTDRVPEGDGAPEDVDLLRVQLQLAQDGEALGGEGLVELEQVHGVRTQGGLLERLAHGGHGTDPHHLRIHRRRRVRNDARDRRESQALRPLRAGQDERGGAVVEAARVAGRDGAAVPERGLQRRQLLGAGVRPRMLVGTTRVSPFLPGTTTGDLVLNAPFRSRFRPALALGRERPGPRARS